MNKENLSYRFYDEGLELLYEAHIHRGQQKKDSKLEELLEKSSFFLEVGNLSCYRVMPKV
ncbi:hypothetical protein GCM10009122_42660 [Fulvivirga kasyanovii]|uniref:Uncharacterized protein n=1 Tax=Fulvivirga kasyanovii TaxID=396812 RepID=A0ABW9RSD4_9BACT|nr:hypothetical protein [Fulvivirga kasyanovii]MTI27077.1 hypothetical protein [Fulvivirga kasyanovii]